MLKGPAMTLSTHGKSRDGDGLCDWRSLRGLPGRWRCHRTRAGRLCRRLVTGVFIGCEDTKRAP